MQLNAIKIKQFSLDLDDYEEIWQAYENNNFRVLGDVNMKTTSVKRPFIESPSLRIEWIGFIFPCNEKLQRRIKTNKLFNGDIKDSLLQILPNIDTDFLELNANRVSIKDKYGAIQILACNY
uniref:Uncharacterized protein n=1 Tax=Acrobeloides nanus TaxID=290746 RepID=A0A914C9N3_9BILA